jgi:hypothetical protein
VLLSGQTGERLEYVAVMRGALLQRPLLHRQRDGIGERRVERLALGERLLQAAEDVFGEPLALDRGAEDIDSEDLVVRGSQVEGAKGGAVGGPLGGADVLLADGHGESFLPGSAPSTAGARA